MREGIRRNGCGPMTLAAAMVVIVVACGISEIGTPEYPKEKEQAGIGSPSGTVCCVSAFEYPSGYDWVKDELAGKVRCSLVVFADGVPKIEVPVGDGFEVSRDPDMHRVVDGNLYTFYSKGGKTVMKRNGAPLFRYDEDEVLVDMSIRDGDVYTLAHKRSGSGFSFRRNGNVLVEKLFGETYGKLWEDGDSLCFAFTQPVVLPDGIEYRNYIAFESEVVQVQDKQGVEKVWDIMSDRGVPCILVSIKGTGDTYMIKGRTSKWIEIPILAQMLSCRLFQADDKMAVECLYDYHNGMRESGIWVDGSEYMRFETGQSIQTMKYVDGQVFCILNPGSDDGIVFYAGQVCNMPHGYFCLDDKSIEVHEGEFHVAMSSRNGGYPLIWHDGRIDTLRVNGCISSISFTQ